MVSEHNWTGILEDWTLEDLNLRLTQILKWLPEVSNPPRAIWGDQEELRERRAKVSDLMEEGLLIEQELRRRGFVASTLSASNDPT